MPSAVVPAKVRKSGTGTPSATSTTAPATHRATSARAARSGRFTVLLSAVGGGDGKAALDRLGGQLVGLVVDDVPAAAGAGLRGPVRRPVGQLGALVEQHGLDLPAAQVEQPGGFLQVADPLP